MIRFKYEWKLELSVKEVIGDKVIVKARVKQMADESYKLPETVEIEVGQTLTFDFPFRVDMPDGAVFIK